MIKIPKFLWDVCWWMYRLKLCKLLTRLRNKLNYTTLCNNMLITIASYDTVRSFWIRTDELLIPLFSWCLSVCCGRISSVWGLCKRHCCEENSTKISPCNIWSVIAWLVRMYYELRGVPSRNRVIRWMRVLGGVLLLRHPTEFATLKSVLELDLFSK